MHSDLLPSSRPNILFLIADDLRHDAMGAAGNPEILTPNMDRLAAGGTRFRNAFIQGGSSGAVCMPSRAMLLTGRGQFEIEGVGQSIPGDHVMLGEQLQKSGYQAHGIGKWHNGPPAHNRCFNSGAEIFFGGMEDHWTMPLTNFDPTGRYENRMTKCLAPYSSNQTNEYLATHMHAGRHTSEIFADAVIEFLRSQDRGQPFFCYAASTAPHDPRTAPGEFHAMYAGREVVLPTNFAPRHAFDYGHSGQRDERLESYPRTPEAILAHRRDYYAIVTHLDRQIGRILDALDDNGLADNTIVVMAADHGLALGEHGLLGKQSLYDHSVRVPLLMRGPGVPSGDVREDFVFLADACPTLCGLAGIPVPASVTARDLFSPESRAPGEIYLSFMSHIRGLRNHQYKLLEYSGPASGRLQLFDVAADPMETNDLSGSPEFTGLIAEMQARLRSARDAHGELSTAHGKNFWETLEKEGR